MTPSVNRMVRLLSKDEQDYVTKAIVIEVESRIVTTLNFDFNLMVPLTFLERYIRLSEYSNNKKAFVLAKEICQRAVIKSMFLEFKPSQIAAVSLIMALNIINNGSGRTSKPIISFKYWNDHIQMLTGYD